MCLQDIAKDGKLLVGLPCPRLSLFLLLWAGGGGDQLLGGEDPRPDLLATVPHITLVIHMAGGEAVVKPGHRPQSVT